MNIIGYFRFCFGVFDSEANEKWIWFMQMLKEAIGSPRGLAICMDARQAVMVGVGEVFPEGEHRECMFHLVSNFKKRYHGKVFDENLWATAYSRNLYLFEKHWTRMEAAKPAATLTNYLRKCHTRLWTRSQFSTNCKVDFSDFFSLSYFHLCARISLLRAVRVFSLLQLLVLSLHLNPK